MITRAMLEAVISRRKGRFDSHDIILEVAHDNQVAYVEALYQERHHAAPFNVLHRKLGREIADICRALRWPERASKSRDMFGHSSGCTEYRF